MFLFPRVQTYGSQKDSGDKVNSNVYERLLKGELISNLLKNTYYDAQGNNAFRSFTQ